MLDTAKASRLFSRPVNSYTLAYPEPKRLPIFLVASLLVLSLIARLSLGLALGPTPVGAAQGDPSFVEDNPTCPTGTVEFKVEPVADGTYSDGTLTVTIDVRDTPEGQVFDFTANIGIDAVIAKGGPDGNVYLYDPEVSAGTGLHAPVKPNKDQFYSLGHISFCYDSELSTHTPTNTPSHTPTHTSTPTSTATPTGTSQVPSTTTATVEPTATTAPSPVTMTSTPTDSPAPSATPTSTPTATPIVTPSATAPAASGHLAITKRDFLFSDADTDDRVSPGDTLFYAITVVNDGVGTTPQLRLEDHPDPNTRLISGSVKVIGGVIVQGNQTTDEQVLAEITPLISGAHVSLSLQVVVNAQISVTQLQNQALVTILDANGQPSGQAPLASDDPDTAALNDATITPLTDPVVELIPSLFLPLIHKAQP